MEKCAEKWRKHDGPVMGPGSGKVAHVPTKHAPKASHVLPPRSDLACYTVGSRQGFPVDGWMDGWMVIFTSKLWGNDPFFESIFEYFAGNSTYPRHFWKDDFTCPEVGCVSCFLEGKDVSNGLKTPGLFAMRTSELPLYHRLAFPRQELVKRLATSGYVGLVPMIERRHRRFVTFYMLC